MVVTTYVPSPFFDHWEGESDEGRYYDDAAGPRGHPKMWKSKRRSRTKRTGKWEGDELPASIRPHHLIIGARESVADGVPRSQLRPPRPSQLDMRQ